MARPETTQEIDFFTKEPRRKNVPYTVLTEGQIKLMKRNSIPLFGSYQEEKWDDSRKFIDRYTYFRDRSQVRGAANTNFNHIGPYITRDLPEDHNCSRFGAMFPWGPDKEGHRTLRNSFIQDCHRFTNIDMYKRNPTNYDGDIRMKYGRANFGYYAQRYPNENMFFGGEDKPKQHWILTDIAPKTFEQYKMKRAADQAVAKNYPNITNYTESMLIRRPSSVTRHG